MKMKHLFSSLIIILILAHVSSAYASSYDYLIIAKDGSGNFRSIQEALNSLQSTSDNHILFIRNGIYNEKILIEKSNVSLVGENKDSTIIEYAILRSTWKLTHPNDYGAAVINIKDSITDIIFLNVTVHNNYGSLNNSTDHQFSIRSGAGVTRVIIDNCKIISDGGDINVR